MNIENLFYDAVLPATLTGIAGAAAFGAIGLFMGRFITHTGAVPTAKVLAVFWGIAAFATIFAGQLTELTSSRKNIDKNKGKTWFVMLSLSCAGSIYTMRQYNIIAKTGTIAFGILSTVINGLLAYDTFN